MLGVGLRSLVRAPQHARGLATRIHTPPPKTGFITFLTSCLVMGGGISAGAYLSMSLVKFVEENDIWKPPEDD